ncbi:FLYWCH-type zinc finger-containing protein 1-like [Ixodes scapularis]|uniref:FLYWCH-type zinc finger-containing protein 1-like n=1 Tax=Ixodes scapularis TaxID=6945 RepID=UPI001A9EDB3F|nr:FLYWCH-type zinc finger-containing protein 1-like [Ixodes scapularis]
MATFVASPRGSPKLCFEGYVYTKRGTTDEKAVWRCEKFQEGCRGRAVTADETTTITQGHTCHLPSPENVAAARLQEEIKTVAKRSHDTPRNVVTACLQGARPATIAKLPPKLSSLERKVNRARREAHGAAQVPYRIQDIIVPEHDKNSVT